MLTPKITACPKRICDSIRLLAAQFKHITEAIVANSSIVLSDPIGNSLCNCHFLSLA